MSRLKFATLYGLKNSEIVSISAMSQSLTCSLVTGEGSFDVVPRNNIHLSAIKSTLNFSVMVSGMISDCN